MADGLSVFRSLGEPIAFRSVPCRYLAIPADLFVIRRQRLGITSTTETGQESGGRLDSTGGILFSSLAGCGRSLKKWQLSARIHEEQLQFALLLKFASCFISPPI
ncbi:hypothetical protein MUK42_36955 [Musa troglodytarum]|uniref:Uncharacterized protein n=1 Tax=Musa troglodytarum TaxID=320322 RepID=A0A9E7FJC7_9LILI|nr:hypothetical protein MUK42_36955 [Musa troglodytarum]